MSESKTWTVAEILATVRRYWGFSELRPLQEEAMRAGLDRRDSLVVMPTGGGKSLCYQVPPELAQRTDIVVSPLIALMKDQVDGLRECGYPAGALHSGMTFSELRSIEDQIAAGRYRLLFVAPERLLTPRFLQFIERMRAPSFAVDEAHCISHWGHDFRPDYRTLGEHLPALRPAPIVALTATATPTVQRDIAAQLRLADPAFFIHGDEDKVVPFKENSAELAARYEAAGAKDAVTLVVAKGQGHNFWEGFFRCPELIEFVIARARSGAAVP